MQREWAWYGRVMKTALPRAQAIAITSAWLYMTASGEGASTNLALSPCRQAMLILPTTTTEQQQINGKWAVIILTSQRQCKRFQTEFQFFSFSWCLLLLLLQHAVKCKLMHIMRLLAVLAISRMLGAPIAMGTELYVCYFWCAQVLLELLLLTQINWNESNSCGMQEISQQKKFEYKKSYKSWRVM